MKLSKDNEESYTCLRRYIVRSSRHFHRIFEPYLPTDFPKGLLYEIAADELDVVVD